MQRGMRQGCPFSPLLFALAIEPLAIALRSAPGIRGYKRGEIEEKLILYTDDLLLLLGDTQNSLRKSMEEMKNFGQFCGLIINYGKYTLLPVYALVNSDPKQKVKTKLDTVKYIS